MMMILTVRRDGFGGFYNLRILAMNNGNVNLSHGVIEPEGKGGVIISVVDVVKDSGVYMMYLPVLDVISFANPKPRTYNPGLGYDA